MRNGGISCRTWSFINPDSYFSVLLPRCRDVYKWKPWMHNKPQQEAYILLAIQNIEHGIRIYPTVATTEKILSSRFWEESTPCCRTRSLDVGDGPAVVTSTTGVQSDLIQIPLLRGQSHTWCSFCYLGGGIRADPAPCAWADFYQNPGGRDNTVSF